MSLSESFREGDGRVEFGDKVDPESGATSTGELIWGETMPGTHAKFA